MDMVLYRKIFAARDEMIAELNAGNRDWGMCACINIVFDTHTHISPNQACHAGLANTYEGNRPSGAQAVVSGLMKPPAKEILDEDEALLFLDWLLNRSPYSETFITKSAHEALYYKATISSAHHPSNLMAAGMVASRRLWEYVNIARVWCDLAKAGVHEDLAFYLGHIFSGKFDRTGNVSYGGLSSGHCSMNPNVMGIEEVKNFLNHKVVRPNKTYHESKSYNGYDTMYGMGNGSVRQWIHKNFPYKPAAKVEKVNPFAPDDDAGGKCSYDHLIKTTVEFQHRIFEHLGYNQQKEAA